jgi:type II pantothenate kinase
MTSIYTGNLKGSGAWSHLPESCETMREPAGMVNRECLRIPKKAASTACTACLDIGGSLAKVAYITTGKEEEEENETQVHLITFDLDNLDSCLKFVKDKMTGKNSLLKMTGVGSHKFREKIIEELGEGVQSDDLEMVHIVTGLNFTWRHLKEEDLLHPLSVSEGLRFQCPLEESNMGPFVVCSIGSAMSGFLVSREGVMQNMVAFNTFAGLSFLGLGVMLTKANNFKELMELAERGDHNQVDLLVRDTLGEGNKYSTAQPEGLVSSFGKAARLKGSASKSSFKEADKANSILYAVTENLTNQAFYVAQSQQVHYVCFCGTFLSGNGVIMSQIISKLGEMSAYLKYDVLPIFLQHEGYMGVIGLLFDGCFQPASNGDHQMC